MFSLECDVLISLNHSDGDGTLDSPPPPAWVRHLPAAVHKDFAFKTADTKWARKEA